MLKESALNKTVNGILPTPPRPDDVGKIDLTENAEKVFIRRYSRRGPDGKPIEKPEDTFWRVAYHVAKVEEKWGADVETTTRTFYQLLSEKLFFPNSPTFTGAGTLLGQLAACFVLPLSDDMGKRGDGIFETLRDAALIQQTGGGNGFSFSRLRPAGTMVKSSAGQATGPVGFLRVYDKAFGEIAQGGTRRGANMAVLRVDHPDIEDFITCKTDENAITNFNISVGVTDAFMHAVEHDEEWDLRFPDVNNDAYRGFSGTLEQAQQAGIPIITHKRVRARKLFDMIVRQAHHNGEPGLLFLDTANRFNPVPHLYELEATNPCGEQWLGPYENCCLGSINLAQHATKNGDVDWDKLKSSVQTATRFLDDVIDSNAYVPAVPELYEAAMNARRIGLGIMGLGDLMYQVGVRYGSEEGQEFSAQVMEFIRFHSMKTSIKLAKKREPFKAIQGSIYDPEEITWTPPKPLFDYLRDWGRPKLNWEEILRGIKKHGIRNAAQTTIAPTGTIATVAGLEGYGCEPVFALAYIRHVNDNGSDLTLAYTSPLFQQALNEEGLEEDEQHEIIEQILETGTCQNIEIVPPEVQEVFVVSQDITAEEHVRMQCALQAFVDNSLSKTINFPPTASENEVARAYQLAWKLGAKGITVYVTGSREKVVLETKETAEGKGVFKQAEEQMEVWHDQKKPRPSRLKGYTFSIRTPLGKAFVTVNENGGNQPFEVFINSAKAGSETAAISEAIGRLMSYVLRLASPISPRDRMKEIINQLIGIGGGRSLGFGPNRVRSLPDGVSQALVEYLHETSGDHGDGDEILHPSGNGFHATDADNVGTAEEMHASPPQIGELCPDCGQATVVNEEGCRKCYTCGYSEC